MRFKAGVPVRQGPPAFDHCGHDGPPCLLYEYTAILQAHPYTLTLLRRHDDLDATILFVSESGVHLWPVFQADLVRDDERRINMSLLNMLQKNVGPPLHMGLAHPESQAFVHGRTEWNLVDQAAV